MAVVTGQLLLYCSEPGNRATMGWMKWTTFKLFTLPLLPSKSLSPFWSILWAHPTHLDLMHPNVLDRARTAQAHQKLSSTMMSTSRNATSLWVMLHLCVVSRWDGT